MNDHTAYEIKAEAFMIMRRMMAPGKDEGMAGGAHSYEERCREWGDWLINNEEIIRAMLKAVDVVILSSEDKP